MLIPISIAIFAPPNKNKRVRRLKPKMIQLRTTNENGHVICSTQFPKKAIKYPSEILVQISLAIWAMNVSKMGIIQNGKGIIIIIIPV